MSRRSCEGCQREDNNCVGCVDCGEPLYAPKEPTEIEEARRAGKAAGLREASVIADEVGTRSNTDLWTAEEIVRAIDARAKEVERE